jgi:hypothetical protein
MFEDPGAKRSRWRVFWPNVDDAAGAEEAIRLCSWFAFANATLGAVGASFLVYTGAVGPAAFWGPALMAALGFGVRKGWRAAALAGAGLLGLGCGVVAAKGALPGVMDVLTFVAFLSGVRGTFALSRHRRTAAEFQSVEAGRDGPFT